MIDLTLRAGCLSVCPKKFQRRIQSPVKIITPARTNKERLYSTSIISGAYNENVNLSYI